MKKLFLISIIFLFSGSLLFSQVAINPDGSPPHPSAGLDVNFPGKGFLLPRLSFEQRNAITNPAEGLMIFCTNCNSDASGALSIYQGGGWRVFNIDCATPAAPLAGTHVPTATQITWNWNVSPIAIGYKWSTENNFSSAIDLFEETTITETGLACFTNFTRYVWAYNSCGESLPLVITQSTLSIPFSTPPAEGVHTANSNTIFWNWNPVAGATGYRWSMNNDYATALDVGTNLIRMEAGLACNTSFTRYVWAYDNCGYSTPTTLTKSTTLNPPATPVAGVHVATSTQIEWKWVAVYDATSYRWNTINDSTNATNIGNVTSFTEMSLPCNSTQESFIWAVGPCGTSVSTTLSKATLPNPPAAPVAGAHIAAPTQIEWKWVAVSGATSYRWNTINDSANATNIGDVTFFTETGLACNISHTSYVWAVGPCGTSVSTTLSKATLPDPPAAPTEGDHVATSTQIEWKWVDVSDGISSYRWNTENDSIGATNIGNVTSYTETGLTCNTPQTSYVWAVGTCGTSVSTTLSESTLLAPPAAPTPRPHVATSTTILWKWTAVTGATSYRWNTIYDSIGATNIGNVINFNEIDLPCNSPQLSYIWAVGPCGTSVVTILSKSTLPAPPPAPTADVHVAASTQIVWKWLVVSGATSYRWNSVNDSTNATDIGNVTSRTETGLTCNSPQTSYVWSVGPCGNSIATILSSSTLPAPPASPTAGDHIATASQIEWKWVAVSGATSYRWNTTNDSVNATDYGLVTSHTESGLPCDSDQTSFVWAVGPCGTSVSTTLSKRTLLDPPAAPAIGAHVAGPTQIQWKWIAVSGATSYRWNTLNDSIGATDIGNVLSFTETGMACNTVQTSYVWAVGPCGTSVSTSLSGSTTNEPPAAPVAGAHVAATTQIEWKWVVVTGATSYRWNTLNDSIGATDLGNVTSKIETGLTCNSPQESYIWSVGPCGNSIATVMSSSTSPVPPDATTPRPHTATVDSIRWKWNTVAGATSYRWNTIYDSIGATDIGNVIFKDETGLACNTPQTSYVWTVGPCGTSVVTILSKSTLPEPPPAPTADVHVAASTQIEWKWVASSGATSYRWNSINDSTNATNIGNVTSYTETGLVCNTLQDSYVWAVGPCGTSVGTSLSQTTTNEAPAVPVAGTHVPTTSQIEWKWLASSGATGYRWNTIYDSIGATDIGNVTSFTETGLACNTSQTSYIWAYNACGVSVSAELAQSTLYILTATPVAGTHVASETQIVWNWNTVSGATGYKWNTVNNYSTATDMFAVTSATETGLVCGSSETSYAWAYNSCGESTPVTLTQSTQSCWTCGNPFTVYHVADTVAAVTKTVNYGTVTNVPGETTKCWITSNLGASNQATSVSDATEASAGWYWQFNRAQGYKHDGTTRTPNTTWISSINEYSNWVLTSDPCALELGGTWRLPTNTEYSNVDASGGWTNWNGPFGSALKMHAAGDLNASTGIVQLRGTVGFYWSSNQGLTTTGKNLYFLSGACQTTTGTKATGYSIRCIKNLP